MSLKECYSAFSLCPVCREVHCLGKINLQEQSTTFRIAEKITGTRANQTCSWIVPSCVKHNWTLLLFMYICLCRSRNRIQRNGNTTKIVSYPLSQTTKQFNTYPCLITNISLCLRLVLHSVLTHPTPLSHLLKHLPDSLPYQAVASMLVAIRHTGFKKPGLSFLEILKWLY